MIFQYISYSSFGLSTFKLSLQEASLFRVISVRCVAFVRVVSICKHVKHSVYRKANGTSLIIGNSGTSRAFQLQQQQFNFDLRFNLDQFNSCSCEVKVSCKSVLLTTHTVAHYQEASSAKDPALLAQRKWHRCLFFDRKIYKF